MRAIVEGTTVLTIIQSLQTPLTLKFMKAVSFLGEEEFYTILLTVMIWLVDHQLGRLTALLMSLCGYITGVLKNIFCLPRPPSPPINPVVEAEDWAFPSHHSVMGVSLPWYIWLYVYVNYQWSPVASTVLFLTIGTWSFSVMFGRMYLGVHSPIDIVCGGLLGMVLLLLWLQADMAIISSLQSGQYILLGLGLILFLFSIHPDPHPKSCVYIETVIMTTVCYGISIGHYLGLHVGVVGKSLIEADPLVSLVTFVLRGIGRLAVGYACILLVKYLVRGVSKLVFKYALSAFRVKCIYEKRRSEVTSSRVYFSEEFKVLDKVCDTCSNRSVVTLLGMRRLCSALCSHHFCCCVSQNVNKKEYGPSSLVVIL